MDAYHRLRPTARAQLGVFTREQALAAGFPASNIDRLLATGRWRRWWDRPVYRHVTLPEDWEATLVAARLCAGDGAVVCRRSAARLWRLDGFEESTAVELVVPRAGAPSLPGATIRTTRRLGSEEVVALGAHLVTSVTRTVHDLAGILDRPALLRIAAEAYRSGRTDPSRLAHSLLGRRRFQGNAVLREVLGDLDPGYARCRSQGEVQLHTALRSLGYGGYLINPRRRLRSGRRFQPDVLFLPHGVLELQSERHHAAIDRRRADVERRTAIEEDGYVYAELWARDLGDLAVVRRTVDQLLAAMRRSPAPPHLSR